MARIRPLLILLLFVLLIAAVLRFETQRREEQQRAKASKRNVPEFFLEQSLTTRYGLGGKIDYQMNSDYLEYFSQNDRAELKNAYFIFYNQDGLSWHSRSNTATLKGRDEIQMHGNVRIWQPDRQMEITTDSLSISEKNSVAETSDLIRMKSPSGQMQSIGMNLDMNAEKLQFISGVSAQYLPVPKPTKAKTGKKSTRLKPRHTTGKKK